MEGPVAPVHAASRPGQGLATSDWAGWEELFDAVADLYVGIRH